MGCYSSQYWGTEFKNAETLLEIIAVMKKKSEDLLKEKKEINNNIKDPNKEVTNVNIENLSKEDLEKRII